MSCYDHFMLRRRYDLNAKQEFILAFLQEFGLLKASAVCTACHKEGFYTKASCLDVMEKLRDSGFLESQKASSRSISTFNMWQLAPKGKFYLQQVKGLYK